MKTYLCFASHSLEQRFRRLVTDSKQEIGGWFLRGYVNDHNLSGRKLKKLIPGPLYVIEHVIIAPNHAGNPEGSWSAWDMKQAADLAKVTARFYGNWPIHFHTHPNATGMPSDGDLAFWQAQNSHGRWSLGCIVTDRPLRLWTWHIEVGLAASPGATTVGKECGGFLSRRSKILKEAQK